MNSYVDPVQREASQSDDAATPRPAHQRALKWLLDFARELDRTRTLGMAAELAFWLFLSLIPLAAVVGLVIARVALHNDFAVQALASLPGEMRSLVRQQLSEVAAWNGGSVAAPAALVFLWLGSGGIHAIFDLLEIKAGCARPWWKKRAIALGTCVALAFGAALIAAIGVGVNRITALLHGVIPVAASPVASTIESTTVRLLTGFTAALVLVAGLYWIGVPRVARKKVHVWPGAFTAVALQSVLGYGYGYYLSKAGSGSAYQAGLSIIGVTLIALYLFAIALLVGAQLNHALTHPAPVEPEGPPL